MGWFSRAIKTVSRPVARAVSSPLEVAKVAANPAHLYHRTAPAKAISRQLAAANIPTVSRAVRAQQAFTQQYENLGRRRLDPRPIAMQAADYYAPGWQRAATAARAARSAAQGWSNPYAALVARRKPAPIAAPALAAQRRPAPLPTRVAAPRRFGYRW